MATRQVIRKTVLAPAMCVGVTCALGLLWAARTQHEPSASPAFAGTRSIAQACSREIVCIWHTIDAGNLCRSHFSRNVKSPTRWIEDRHRFDFRAAAQADTDTVRYQADDVLVLNHLGEYEQSTYACDIFVGAESPSVIRSQHSAGRLRTEG